MTEIEFCLNKSFYFIFYLNLSVSNFYVTMLINEKYAQGILPAWAHAWNMFIFNMVFSQWYTYTFMLIKKGCMKYKNIYVWKICREDVEYLLPLYKVRFLCNSNAIPADSSKRKWKTYQLQIAVPVVYPRYVPQEELGRYSYMGTWLCKGKVNSGGMLALNRKLFIKYDFIYLKDHNQFFFQN